MQKWCEVAQSVRYEFFYKPEASPACHENVTRAVWLSCLFHLRPWSGEMMLFEPAVGGS
jgi:hypothetical protein